MQQEPLSIDVEKVLHSKNPALARLLPGFIVSWLKRIVHQEEINAFLKEKGHLRDHDFVAACFAEMGATAQVEGLENIPLEGGCVVASNHPLGGLDGIGLMKVVGQRRLDIRFFVNDILLNLVSFGDLFVGVNKHGKNPKEALRQMDEVFASDQCVLFFPAGLVSRRQPDGSIQDLEWQKSFIAKSVRYQKPIIPTFIGGQNSSFFYNLSYWRKRLGIKANIEMLFLVDEIYRQRGNTLRFVFGPPIPPETFTKDRTHAEWAQALKDYVYRLGKGDKTPFE
ncbi:MAG: 1-acyl-sn-glycerol-3-phosphate acyltransferase [Saprospiraceae bacterium]|nr:1-acyl-sn-glycerol-3-phosphate acyltransferase [Saprospiraceae bacterium]